MKISTWILGIDNGVSGSFALMDPSGNIRVFSHVPTYKERKWTKPKVKKLKSGVKHTYDYITLIDIDAFQRMLVPYTSVITDIHCFLERPAISYAAAWSMKTSISAAMSWANVVYVLKRLQIPRTDVDSKDWQRILIPEAMGENNKEYMKTLKAGDRNKLLKEASDMNAKEIWPKFVGKELGDGDSINLCEYGRRKLLGEF